MVYNAESMSNSPTPLSQRDLNDETLVQMKCVSFSIVEWNRIVNSMSKGASLDCDYTKIVIKSSVSELGQYNFFHTVCGNTDSGWFGYRVLGHCTFAKFCGALNCLNIGTNDVMGTTDLILQREVVELNRAKGFPSVEDLYLPSRMLETFNYDPCNVHSRDMPIAYIMNPFTARDEDGDEPLRVPHYSFGTNSSPQKHKTGIDDNQSNGNSDSPPLGGFPGSSPLQDITNYGRESPRESHHSPRPVKRRRVITDDDESDEQARNLL